MLALLVTLNSQFTINTMTISRCTMMSDERPKTPLRIYTPTVAVRDKRGFICTSMVAGG
jgi:hypothetical protein